MVFVEVHWFCSGELLGNIFICSRIRCDGIDHYDDNGGGDGKGGMIWFSGFQMFETLSSKSLREN